MNIQEFIKRHKEVAKESGINIEVSDEEYTKMFLSHIVVREWDIEEEKKVVKREKRKSIRRHS